MPEYTISKTATGTYTWKCPPDVSGDVIVECWGPGGPGGATNTTIGQSAGGGGGGSYAKKTLTLSPGDLCTYFVGKPGTSADASVPVDSTDTTFSVDGVGIVARGRHGASGVGLTANGAGGAGGVFQVGDGDSGYSGGDGAAGVGGVSSGAGGGGAGTLEDGGDASGTTVGEGGDDYGGDGAVGRISATDGLAGSSYGGGGSGGTNTTHDYNEHGGSGGSGRVLITYQATESVVEISDVNDLQGVAYGLERDYILTDDIDASATATWNWNATRGVYEGFIPIGTVTIPVTDGFFGLFDGSGKTISNLYVNRNDGRNCGLFGHTTSASEVRNLTLTGVSITNLHATGYAAGMAAYGDGVWTNCHASGTVQSHYASGFSAQRGVHINCSANCTVISVSYAGMLVGSSLTTQFNYNCLGHGSISGTGVYIGGAVGTTNRFINSIVNVDVASSYGSLYGPFAGAANYTGALDNFYNTDRTITSGGSDQGSEVTGETTANLKKIATFSSWKNIIAHTGDVIVKEGTATSATASTLVDSGGIGLGSAHLYRTVTITAGTGIGQTRVITANDTTAMTVYPDWRVTPDATSEYMIRNAWFIEEDTTYPYLADPYLAVWAHKVNGVSNIGEVIGIELSKIVRVMGIE